MHGTDRHGGIETIPFDAVKEALRQQAEKDSLVAALVPSSNILGTVTEDDVDHQRAWMSQSYDASAQPRSSPIVPPRSTSLHGGKKSRFYTDVPDDQQPSAEKRSLSTSAAPDPGKVCDDNRCKSPSWFPFMLSQIHDTATELKIFVLLTSVFLYTMNEKIRS